MDLPPPPPSDASSPLPPPPPSASPPPPENRYEAADGRHERHAFDDATDAPDLAAVEAAVATLAARVAARPPSAAHNSVSKGRAGAALALLRAVETGAVADGKERTRLLSAAADLAEQAARHYESAPPGNLRVTFLEGAAGAFAVRAATRAASGHGSGAFESCLGVLSLAPWVLHLPEEACELSHGRAGATPTSAFCERAYVEQSSR